MEEFLKQSEEYQDLNEEGLNQFYKLFLYNGGNGGFLTHPFPVERAHYLQIWSKSEEYRQISQGHYQRKDGVEVNSDNEQTEAEDLRRQIEELQEEIDKIRRRDG